MKRKLYIFLIAGIILSCSSASAQRFGFGGWFDVPGGASIVTTKGNIAIPENSYKVFYINKQVQVHPVLDGVWGFKFFMDYRRFTAAFAIGAAMRHSSMTLEMPQGDGSLVSYIGVVKEVGPYLPISVGYVFANTRRARFAVSGGVSYLYAISRKEDSGINSDLNIGPEHQIMSGILYTDNRHLLSTTIDLLAGWNWLGWYVQMGPRYERRMVGIGKAKTHPGFITASFELTFPIAKNVKGYKVYINEE